MTRSSKHKLTYPLISILIIVCLVLAGYYFINKMMSAPIVVENIKIDTKAMLKLNALKQISKKNGIREWELNAASATLLKAENKAILDDVRVIFYTKENQKVLLVSDKGKLNTKSHDMTFSDNVIVTYTDAVLKTDKLHYNKKKHIIYADSKVRLEKQDSTIEADSMTTQLNTNMTVFEGNVKGQFSENFNLE